MTDATLKYRYFHVAHCRFDVRGMASQDILENNVLPGRTSPSQQTPARVELPRSISTTNLETTGRCRSVIQNDWKANAPLGGTNYFVTTPGFTLILPSLSDYPSDFQKFVFSRIVAKDTQENMEREYCLNWCPNVTKLVPLYTMGDGNCLLHAASLAMWGFQDRDLILRRAVSHAVNDNIQNNTLYQRWKHNREVENQQEYGLELEPHQWQQEWQMVRQQTAATALSGRNLESLDEFHAFVLANVLRRPIIMYAAPKLRSYETEGTLQKINFHGIYLPLLWAPDSCKKDPLPLAYHVGHFSALVVVESAQQYRDGHLLLPLSDYYSQQLPVRFTLPVEDPSSLMMDYLDLVQVSTSGSPYFSRGNIVCAKLTISDVPSYLKPLISGFIDACYEAFMAQKQPNQFAVAPGPANVKGQNRPPCINNCGMYGDPATGLCSKCHQKAIGAAHAQEKAALDDKTPQQPQGQFQQHVYEHSHQPNVPVQEPQSETTSGAIKCPRCNNPGHPSFLGMCEQCFSSTSTKQSLLPEDQGEQLSSPRNIHGIDPVYEDLPLYQNSPNQTPPLHVQNPPAVPPPRNTSGGPVERSQCRTPGCEFFGTKETRFYCSKCFESNMDRILKEVDGTNGSNVPQVPPPQPQYLLSSGNTFMQPAVSLSMSSTVTSPQVLGVPKSIREPPKCYRCKHFFANEEYSGMCHGCFMKWTQAESQEAPQQSQWGRTQTEPKYQSQANQQFYVNKMSHQNCSMSGCSNPATDNGFCEYCNAVCAGPSSYRQPQNSPAYQSSQTTTSSVVAVSRVPIPKPRTKFATQNQPHSGSTVSHSISDTQITTAPVMNLTSSMADVAISARETPKCFLCIGGSISVNNFVCEDHARKMLKMMSAQFSSDAVHSNPAGTIDQRSALPYEDPVSYSNRPFGQPNQPTGTQKADGGKSNIQFGVPLTHNQSKYDAGPVLSAAGGSPSKAYSQVPVHSSEYQPGFMRYQDDYLHCQQDQSHRFNNFGSHAPPKATAYGAYAVEGDIDVAGAMGRGTGGGRVSLPAKTLCATPGCSFKGYDDLHKLCPDCYQEKYNKPAPAEYPLV